MKKYRKKQIFLFGLSIILFLVYKIILRISDQNGYVLIEPYRTNFSIILVLFIIVSILISIIMEFSNRSPIIKNNITNVKSSNNDVNVSTVKNTIFFVIALKVVAFVQLIVGVIVSIIILQDGSSISDIYAHGYVYIKIVSISIIITSIIIFIFLMLVSYTAENIVVIRVNSDKLSSKEAEK